MAEKLGPTRILAILPITNLEGNNRRQQAEVCCGIACFLERRLSRGSGLETLLPHPGTASRSSSAEHGIPPEFQPVPMREHQPTHVLRGHSQWDDEGNFRIRFEVVELASAAQIYEDCAKITANREGLEGFFNLLGGLTERLTGSTSVARLVAMLPTRSAKAFRQFLAGLAAAESWRRGLVGAQRSFDYMLEALRFDPEFSEALDVLLQLADECVAEEDTAEQISDTVAALEALRQAAELAPGEHRILAHLGLALHGLKNDNAAQAHLRVYVEKSPRGELASRCYAALAAIERELGNDAQALVLLRKATHLEPDNPVQLEALGDLLDATGDLAGAASAWRRSLQEDADRTSALIKLSRASIARREYVQAIYLLERLLGIQPSNEEARGLLVTAMLESGAQDRANEMATAWAESEMGSYAAWSSLARVRHRLGHRDAVNYCLERALRCSQADSYELRKLREELEPQQRESAATPPLEEKRRSNFSQSEPELHECPAPRSEEARRGSGASPTHETTRGFMQSLLGMMRSLFRGRNRQS